MKKSQIVKKHISTLEHFFEESGFPLRVAISEAAAKSSGYLSPSEVSELCANSPSFEVKGGLLFKNNKKDYELLAAYWEYRLKEEQKEVNRLINAAEKFRLEVGL